MTSNHLLLYRLTELMFEHEQHILPVDMLFDDEQIGDFVKSIQIDSPYQQMLMEGVLTESIRDEKVFVSFTVEGYFHYVLGEVVHEQMQKEDSIGLKFIADLVERSSFSHINEGVSQFFIKQINLGNQVLINEAIVYNFESKTFLTPSIVQSLLYKSNDSDIFKCKDPILWRSILQKLIQISKYELASKCINSMDICFSKHLLSHELIPHLKSETLQLMQENIGQSEIKMALLFYLGRYDELNSIYENLKFEDAVTGRGLLILASTMIDIGKFNVAIELLTDHTYNEDNFIERNRLASIAYNGLNLNSESLESISIAIKKSNELYGQYHLKTSELINLNGLYLLVENDFQGSINCFNKCANIYKKIKGDNNFEFATTINNMGLVHYHSGNFNNAKECWEQTILILNSLGMRNHPETANIYKSLACCLEKLDQMLNAQLQIKIAIDILIENKLDDSDIMLEFKQVLNRVEKNDL